MRNIDFEWRADGGSGRWEIIAQTKKRPRRKWPHWLWIVLLSVVLVSAAIGYVIVRRRYGEVNRQIAFQIQNVIDLEAQAWAKADSDLFMAQQDEASIGWYARQARCIRAERRQSQDRCWPVLPAKLQEVNLQGDVAWVEVVEGNELVRRMRFYRRTDRGWKHTAPRVEFWKNAVEFHYGDLLIFRYHQRDQPHVDALIKHMGEAFYDLCAATGCPQDDVFEVDFFVGFPVDDLPRVDGAKLTLASPWLSGIPVEGNWSEAHLQSATYWLASMVASNSLRAGTYPLSGPLQRATVDEYTAWFSTKDPAQAPLLGRIVARHGMDVLPEVFASLRRFPSLNHSGQSIVIVTDPNYSERSVIIMTSLYSEQSGVIVIDEVFASFRLSLNSFLSRWLSLSSTPPDQAHALFETLLNVEREALLVGRRETFLLLQDTSNWEFVEQQRAFFDEFQQGSHPAPPAVEVLAVEVRQGSALVTVKVRDATRQTVFRLLNGGWKHSDPIPIR